jgi:hypothetical protein
MGQVIAKLDIKAARAKRGIKEFPVTLPEIAT